MTEDIEYYNYKAYQNLKERLGLFDAVIECNDLALREFIANKDAAEDPAIYIKNLSLKHSVKVDSVNNKMLTSRIRHFYIMSVSQQVDQFFDEFRIEHKLVNESKWENKQVGEIDLDYILRTLCGTTVDGVKLIGEELYEGYQYYRKVRNRFAHSDKDDRNIDNQYIVVEKFKPWYLENYSIKDSPKIYNEISFDDFRLFSVIVKEIAFKFCMSLRPSVEQLSKEIIRQSKIEQNEKEINKVNFKSFRGLKNKPQRYLNALTNFLNTNFGRFKKSDILAISKILDESAI